MVSLYLHFYWCSKLQIAFSSFCLCLCVEETEKKILICSSWPYINHYSEVKWCELDSSLNKTSGGRQGTLEAVLSLELFWKFCFFKWVHCLLLYCAKLELTLMQKKKKIHTETGLKQTAFSFSANSLSRTCTIYYILCRATQQLVRHIDYLAIFCTGPIWIGPLPQSLSYSNKQQSLHSARVQLLISQWITVHQSRTPLSFFPLSLLSHFLSKWVTVRRWNFIVYVFIHCEAGITDFTRSFKQMSEYSIDWNVNTGSHWARVTQLDIQPLSSLSFIVSQRSKSVFLKLLIKLLQLLSRSGDLGK